MEYEKTQALISEADRAFELIGRAIRMASYRNIQSTPGLKNTKTSKKPRVSIDRSLEILKGKGYQGSDALYVRHELSDAVDFDCIGNVLTQERTKNLLAYQGFIVDRQSSIPKGIKANGGSLICQSLDRQGRIQNTTLMNGVNSFKIEEMHLPASNSTSSQKIYEVTLQMTDGAQLNITLERIFATRNFL